MPSVLPFGSLPRTSIRILAAAAALSLAGACASVQDSVSPAPPPRSEAPDDARMAWWREARFGLFVHWGLYAIPAGEWGDRKTHGEWIRTTAKIPLERYDALREQWNPTKFDADAWARAARDAGMEYMVVTTKHHDGFCLFDSRETDWDVMSTPWKRDAMKEIAAANARAGIVTGWYHSIMDWHHPDYLPRRDWEDRPTEGADFDRFERYLRAQVTELLTNYGRVGVMWFDGEWEQNWNHERGRRLYELCRSLQPDVIVNNRVDVGRSGMAGLTVRGDFVGDFGTPEQEVPPTGLPGVDWESCMTMNGQWGYNAADKDFKSTRVLVRTLIDIASKGGNFLLNVGPTATGEFPPECLERLQQIGAWMRVNGRAIHGTRASPLNTPAWGRVTMKEEGARTHLYLHVFDWPADGRLVLDGIGNDVSEAHLLADASRPLVARRDDRSIVLEVPPRAPDADASVVEVVVRGRPIVYAPPRVDAPSDEFVRSTRVRVESASDDVIVHYTLDGSRPTLASPLAGPELVVSESTTLRACGFHRGRAVTDVVERRFVKVDPAPARTPRDLIPGLARGRDRAGGASKPVEAAAKITGQGDVVPMVALTPADRKCENVRVSFDGYVRVPHDDVYTFALSSDDGSVLRVNGRVVCDNDGPHSMLEKRGHAALAAGWHRIEVDWFNQTGGGALELLAGAAGEPLKALAPEDLAHEDPVTGADVEAGETDGR